MNIAEDDYEKGLKMARVTIDEMLEAAIEAVEYVGQANWEGRESAAIEWLRLTRKGQTNLSISDVERIRDETSALAFSKEIQDMKDALEREARENELENECQCPCHFGGWDGKGTCKQPCKDCNCTE